MTHFYYGADVCAALSDRVRNRIDRRLFDLGTVGPDLWFSRLFYAPGRQNGLPERGGIAHTQRTGDFLSALAEEARSSDRPEAVFSYLAGCICHYTLDRKAHPYIIYRTGHWDGTDETRKNRGNHMYLERAIDHRYLKARSSGRGNPILRGPLRLRRLPDPVIRALDRTFLGVYGWTDAGKELSRCIGDQRLLYRLVWDRTGLLDRLLHRLDHGRGKTDLTALSYHGKARPRLDVLNEHHAVWNHPCDERLRSPASFPELAETARNEAVRMIDACFGFILCGSKEHPQLLIGNASYETGLDCGDPRNREIFACMPLILK